MSIPFAANLYGIGVGTAQNFAPVIADRAPSAADITYRLGQPWIDKTANTVHVLTSLSTVAGLTTANWALSSPGSTDVDALAGDSGTDPVVPSGGKITLKGGTNLASVGGTNEITFNLDAAITLATSVTSPIYTSAAAMAINVAGGSNITMKMGDAGGANKISFTDSADAEVADLDSDGTLTVVNMDGIIGATTPAAVTGTTITAGTTVVSPIYTSTGAVDTNINAVAGQDIIIQMGDNGGVNKVSFEDSDSAEVFSIDSNGGLSTLTALVVAGAFTQTAGVVSISEDNSANAVGIANGTTARVVDLASSAAAHVVTIGSVTGAASLGLLAGTGNFIITGATATTMTIGTGLTTGTITLGATGNTGTMTLSSSTGAQTVNIANADGTKAINIGAGVDGNTISLGNGINTSAQVINVANAASGANTTLNIMSGIGTAGAGVIAFGNNTRVTTIGIADIAPAAARVVTICGGDGAQNDTVSVLSDNPSANTQTFTVLGGIPTGGTQVANILTQTGQAGTVNIGTGAAMANTIVIGGTGANVVTIANTQTGGSIAIGDAMTGGTIDIGGSGAQTGTITISASTAAQTIAIANTGGKKTIGIGDGVDGTALTLANGINTSAQTVDIAGGASGANSTVSILSGNATAGTSTLNLGTGTGGKTVNIASGAGVNVVTLGSANTTSSLTLQAGSGNITATGTFEAIDTKVIRPTGIDLTFKSSPTTCTAADTGGVATGSSGDINLLSFKEGIIMEQFIMGTQTIIKPVMDETGLLCSLDLASTEGAEYNFGAARALSEYAFTIGTSAAFFFEVKLTLADVSAGDPYFIGFRKVQANNITFSSYTDYYALGMNEATSETNIILSSEKNGTGQTLQNSDDAWPGGDAGSATLKVFVSAAGVVTATIDGSAPTTPLAFTFDNADVVCPCIHLFHSTITIPGAIHLVDMAVGFQ